MAVRYCQNVTSHLAPDRMDFCKDGMNAIDALAIMPYFVTIGIDIIMETSYTEMARPQVATFLRLVRIFRALRILKLSRYSRGLRMLGLTLSRSARVLSLLVMFQIVLAITFGSTVYFLDLGMYFQ